MKPWQEQNDKTIQKGLAIIRSVPFTRLVALTGSLAENRATEKSDIDFFVQVKPGHIWATRFFITLLVQLAGIRRTDSDIAGKICLNWFATYNAPAKQKGRIYKVLWAYNKVSLRLRSENKSSLVRRGGRGGDEGSLKPFFEKLFSSFWFSWVEKVLKKVQIARIERDIRTYEPGSQVRYSDTELGFHPPKHTS